MYSSALQFERARFDSQSIFDTYHDFENWFYAKALKIEFAPPIQNG